MTIPNLTELIKNKKVIIAAVIFIGIIILAVLASSKKAVEQQPINDATNNNLIPTQTEEVKSQELQAAIASQQKTDQEYSQWQESTRTNYPWIKVLPLYGDKYFLYFDISKKVFVGKIYSAVSDNVEQIKTQIKADLQAKLAGENINSSSFKYEWKIIPQ